MKLNESGNWKVNNSKRKKKAIGSVYEWEE